MKKTFNFNWIIFSLFAIGFIFLVLSLSFRLPFFPGVREKFFFEFYFPIIVFSSLCFLYLRKGSRGRPLVLAYQGHNPSLGKGLKAVLLLLISLIFFSFLLGSSAQFFLAYPTRFFAKEKFSEKSIIVDSYKYSFSFRGSNKIKLLLLENNQEVAFLWPSSLSDGIEKGRCVNLTGRKWFLGSYVDSVSLISCN